MLEQVTGRARVLSGGAAAAAGLALAGPVLGQLVPPAQVGQLRQVVPGGSDAEPMISNNEVVPIDLRAPTGFEGVYMLERNSVFGERRVYYARQDGGITAVFPRSVYANTARGQVAQIPPDTVFVIGNKLEMFNPHRDQGLMRWNEYEGVPRSANWIDDAASSGAISTAAPSGMNTQAPAGPVWSAPIPSIVNQPSMWTDDASRRRMVGDLLQSTLAPKPR